MAVRDGFGALGLPRTASSREVRRAYARLLKATRPDEDPQAFQRLHEAYEHALAMATWRERQAAATAEGDAPADEEAGAGDAGEPSSASPSAQDAPAPASPPASPPTPPRAMPAPRRPERPRPAPFALEPFLDELGRQLGVEGRLRGWLQQHEALWDLELKQALALPIARALPVRDFLLDEPEYEALRQFFGIDATLLHRHHLSPQWHLIERRARAHAHDLAARQRLEAMTRSRGDRDRHDEGVRPPDTSFWLDYLAWRELYAPPDSVRRFMLTLLPTGPLRAARMLGDLERRIGPEAAAKALEHGGKDFWRSAGDIGRYTPERLRIGARRLITLAGTWVLAQGYLTQVTVFDWPANRVDLVLDIATKVLAIGATWAALGAIVAGVVRWRRGRAA